MTANSTSRERVDQIESILTRSLQPAELRIKDQSHLHVGHAGAASGLGHFSVYVVAEQFSGLTRIQRHRIVYEALGTLLETDIHALKIEALAPGETHPSGNL
ncbi:MAG TPA: BolA family protein [Woeseiaceae bacterium]|nr:BolA family protein [Woeseiaceae bacterium]